MCLTVFSSRLVSPLFGTPKILLISWRTFPSMERPTSSRSEWVTMERWTTLQMRLGLMRSSKTFCYQFTKLTGKCCYLIEKDSIRGHVHRLEGATTVGQFELGFTKIGLGIGCLSHLGRGRHNSLGTTSTPTLLLFTTTFLLDVHHTPNNEDEH